MLIPFWKKILSTIKGLGGVKPHAARKLRLWRCNFNVRSKAQKSGSVAEWTQAQWGLGSNRSRDAVGCLRQTVHTHLASVYQAKLAAALLSVARVPAGLVESNGSLPLGLWLTSHAGWLPRTGISSGILRSVIKYGRPLPFFQKLTWVRLIYSTEPTTKKWKTEKLKKRLCSQVSENRPGNPLSQSGRRKGRLRWEGFAEKEVLKPGMKEWRGDGWWQRRVERTDGGSATQRIRWVKIGEINVVYGEKLGKRVC